jgi:hypothetical protein
VPTEFFPRGAISSGSGELAHVQNIKLSYNNNAVLVHTIARTPAGFTLGTKEAMISFQSAIGADGQDLDTLKKIQQGEVLQFRLKAPGKTMTLDGIFTKNDIDFPLDKEITESLEVIGDLDFD